MSESSPIIFPAELLDKLRTARTVVILTGAGISAESGLPTFRDQLTGLWAKYDPFELATRQAFEKNPRLVWDWYAWRRELASQVEPNPGHFALAEMEKHVPNFWLYTQNVDGLHRKAGSQNVYELHGNLHKFKCFEKNHPVPAENWDANSELPPRCPECGGRVRPDIVWFGENLPQDILHKATKLTDSCDIYFSIGTSGAVEPAASLPVMALQNGAIVVYINLEVTTGRKGRRYDFNGKAGQFLPALVKATWS